MSAINKKELAKIINLYQSGYSAREIAKSIGASRDAVYYFFRKHGILRRSARENNQLIFKNKKQSFKVKSKLTRGDELLKIAGVMLYWGEGSQWSGEKIVDFANSNPDMVRIFLQFLRKVCGVNNKKLRAYLYCYKNQKIDELIKFWSKITKISSSQFTKPYVKKDCQLDNKKMIYGLIHIRYGDKKLLLLIKDWISDFAHKYKQKGSVPK